jgi:hypothetical protein
LQGGVRRQGDTYANIGNTYAATGNTSLRRVRKEGVRLCEGAHMRAFWNISSECMLLRSQLNFDTEGARYTSQLGFDRGRMTVTEKDLLGDAIRGQGASSGLCQSVIGALGQ